MTVLNRALAPTRRMLVDQKTWDSHQSSQARKTTSTCGPRKSRITCSGVRSFAVESQAVVIGAALALCVLAPDDEASAEIDGQLFTVLSALTDGETFEVVTSVGGDRGFESRRKLHKRRDPYTAGGTRSLVTEMVSPSRAQFLELMGAIERIGDLVRRYCFRRDAQGYPHTLADGIRVSSQEALLLDDVEKHAQLNRAILTSCVDLREEFKNIL